MDDYTHDRDGNRVYAGDYVRCAKSGYMGFKVGERRRVQAVSMDKLIMRNAYSPDHSQTSAYNPANFTLSERHHAWHKSKEANMAKNTLYLALRIGDNSYEAVADAINGVHDTAPVFTGEGTRADTSYDSLQAWLRQRIRANPDERWLVLTGTVLAETPSPPVSFRQV